MKKSKKSDCRVGLFLDKLPKNTYKRMGQLKSIRLTICRIQHIIVLREEECSVRSFFYDTVDGKCPVQELLDSLEPKLLAKTLRTIDLLEMNGPILRESYSKQLKDGIFELRTKKGTDITRVLYFFFVGKKVILTNGFVKKTKKTPKLELERAKRYKLDYEWRYENESL